MKLIKVKIGKKIFAVKDCRGISSVRGLMFDDMKNLDGALIYANCIWMPFVKRKLRLIFLDDKMEVVGFKTASPISFNKLETWKIYKNGKARYCLELKDMSIKINKNIKINFLGPWSSGYDDR